MWAWILHYIVQDDLSQKRDKRKRTENENEMKTKQKHSARNDIANKKFEKCAAWILHYIVQDGMSQNKPLNENEMQTTTNGNQNKNNKMILNRHRQFVYPASGRGCGNMNGNGL